MNQMRNRTVIFSGVLIVFTLLTVNFAAADVLKGRDYVRLGKLGVISGTLVPDQHEWTLKAGDTVYDIHLGPSAYQEYKGLTLKQGAEATVKGFIYKNQVAVSEISTAGKTVQLRDQTGRPAWAGSRFARGGYRHSAAPASVPGQDLNLDAIPKMEVPQGN